MVGSVNGELVVVEGSVEVELLAGSVDVDKVDGSLEVELLAGSVDVG